MEIRPGLSLPLRRNETQPLASPVGRANDDQVDSSLPSDSWWQRARQLAGAAGGAGAGLTASAVGVSLLAHPLLSSTADPRVQIAAGLGIAAVTLVGGAAGAVLGWNLLKREA